MSGQAVSVLDGAKESVGRTLRKTLIKTRGRLKISSKRNYDCSFDEIDTLGTQVKSQLNRFNHVSKLWNKYEEKSADAAAASKSLEEAIMVSCGIKQVQSTTEITRQFFVDDSQETFEDMKKKLEQFLKELKDADNLRQNYFAFKIMYEKANDYKKKENEKQIVDKYQLQLSQMTERLQREISRQLSDNEARMYDCMMRYYQKKLESLAAVVGVIIPFLLS
ncbi:unnamed protein product [Hymenolepis diminuta]|uniref:BAR domain-containing protein n=1 Tax=Hymenolepis diminuta TaxID=6216 RepID=A0A564YVS4_HYMDI|nr:unnamed protein product [Hymenolepis diminuta]